MNSEKLMLALALTLFVAAPVAASTTWYVDGVHGSDNNDCKSLQHACKTIGHAISLASSGDSIFVAAATYTENLTVGISLRILGGNASTTIIDGGGVGTVVTIPNASASVTLSKLTITNGFAEYGGGINNTGALTINRSTISENSAFCRRRCSAWGGGIDNEGTLTINSSTISENSAVAMYCVHCIAEGGGIYNAGALTINNGTISGNATSSFVCQYACYTAGGGMERLLCDFPEQHCREQPFGGKLQRHHDLEGLQPEQR